MSEKYFVMRGEKNDGPYSLDDLKYFVGAGVLKADDLCASEGDPEWRKVRVVVPTARNAKRPSSGLVVAGVLLCVGGILAAGYFVIVFDVSRPSALGPVANIDLMSQRQSGVILSAVTALAGVICLIANAVRK